MTDVITEPMQIEQYVELMKMNRQFYPGITEKLMYEIAKFNIDTGISEVHFKDGKMIAVAGIRYRGIGEPWFVSTPELRENKFLLYRKMKKTLPRMAASLNLWRMYANSKINDNFLHHLNFTDEEKIFAWTLS